MEKPTVHAKSIDGMRFPPREGELHFETAGNLDDNFIVEPGIHGCGHISDGVALRTGSTCGYILSMVDLERIVEAARERRATYFASKDQSCFLDGIHPTGLDAHECTKAYFMANGDYKCPLSRG